ncbi:hypothetical protein DYB36_013622, partial [Aphanomyces astaci]
MQVDPDHDNVHDGNVSGVDRETEIDDVAVNHAEDSADQDEKQVTEAKEDDTADDESYATLEQDVPVTKLGKPLSAYFHFLAENRAIVVAKNPGLGVGPVQEILSTKWNELSAEGKEVRRTLSLVVVVELMRVLAIRHDGRADKKCYLNQSVMDQGIDIEAAPRVPRNDESVLTLPSGIVLERRSSTLKPSNSMTGRLTMSSVAVDASSTQDFRPRNTSGPQVVSSVTQLNLTLRVITTGLASLPY